MRAAAVDGRPAGYGWATGPWTPDGISATRLHVSLGRLAPQGTVVTVTLRYAVAHDAMGRGLGLILQPNGEGAPLVQSRSSPYYTRWWLPTNDAPFEVQSVEATLRVPEGWAAAANGAVVGDPATGVGRDAAGHRVFRFVQADPIPSYLIAVAAGAFAVQTEALCLDDPDPSADVDPDAAVPPADCATADRRVPIVRYNAARYDAEVAAMADEVRYLDRHLGPWPHAKLGVIRGPHPYNMEYPGLIALRSFSADVAAHEAAHAWFGNRVRIASWGDFWIKEGLAEFLSRFRVHAYEANACDCDTARLDEARTFDPMRILNLGLRSSGSTPYCKGMAAFVDLTDRLARALGVTMDDRSARVAMLAVLRDLYRAFEGRALTTGDLVGHLRARLGAASTAAGAPLSDAEGAALVDAWARRWLTGTYALR
ncbi:MAG: M1 family aminopeptidase [Anaerolineae bacterium]